MGILFVEGAVTGITGKQESLRFLLDSGATYTLLPNDTWRSIGLVAKRAVRFSLADGALTERQVSECHITIPQGEGHTPVILGERGDEPLLGTITLENLCLVLNPFSRTLQPMRTLLASRVAEKVDSAMLRPIRFAHSSTSLTVPERSRREGRLFACHSNPAVAGEESLSLRAQGRLREESAFQAEEKELRFFASLRMT